MLVTGSNWPVRVVERTSLVWSGPFEHRDRAMHALWPLNSALLQAGATSP